MDTAENKTIWRTYTDFELHYSVKAYALGVYTIITKPVFNIAMVIKQCISCKKYQNCMIVKSYNFLERNHTAKQEAQ